MTALVLVGSACNARSSKCHEKKKVAPFSLYPKIAKGKLCPALFPLTLHHKSHSHIEQQTTNNKRQYEV